MSQQPTKRPSDASAYPVTPHEIDNAILDKAGLHKHYRKELTELTLYLEVEKKAGDDLARFTRNLLNELL